MEVVDMRHASLSHWRMSGKVLHSRSRPSKQSNSDSLDDWLACPRMDEGDHQVGPAEGHTYSIRDGFGETTQSLAFKVPPQISHCPQRWQKACLSFKIKLERPSTELRCKKHVGSTALHDKQSWSPCCPSRASTTRPLPSFERCLPPCPSRSNM
ncbi:hypothetical protein SELMODRAFT_403560 [Selaginella moellendorffii]|uniref:Uncharacterized protein n=1 Tax=Selaginella moellendorffii TaxID=88036 RepID=D8QRT4_SELML|nr:hypothetical protein SELMODRAFT_403560 [Selaginella moellendorffii]